jgi:uncharacterized coiled-coil protein SlyX
MNTYLLMLRRLAMEGSEATRTARPKRSEASELGRDLSVHSADQRRFVGGDYLAVPLPGTQGQDAKRSRASDWRELTNHVQAVDPHFGACEWEAGMSKFCSLFKKKDPCKLELQMAESKKTLEQVNDQLDELKATLDGETEWFLVMESREAREREKALTYKVERICTTI